MYSFRHQVAIVLSSEIGWTRGLAWDHEHKFISGHYTHGTRNIMSMHDSLYSKLILHRIKRAVTLHSINERKGVLRVFGHAQSCGASSSFFVMTPSHQSSIH